MSFFLSKWLILQPRIQLFSDQVKLFFLLSKFLQISYVLTILFTAMATCNEVTFGFLRKVSLKLVPLIRPENLGVRIFDLAIKVDWKISEPKENNNGF